MDNLEKLKKFYHNKRVLVTGSTGFVGGWMLLFLKKLNAKVYGIGLNPDSKPNFFTVCKLRKLIRTEIIDISDKKKVENIISKIKPDIIFHLAAQPIVLKSFSNPYETFNSNFMGTLNILESCKKFNFVKNLIIFTTDKVYFNENKKKFFRENDYLFGDDPYAASKAASEQLIKTYSNYLLNNNPKVIVIRAGNIIGGGDWSKFRIIPDLVRSWRNKKFLKIRNKNSIRPWQFILDVLYQTIKLPLKINKKYDVFNISPNKNNHITVLNLIHKVQRHIKINFNLKKIDSRNIFKNEKKYLFLNSEKINKILKIKSTNINEIIKKTFSWYVNFYEGKNIRKFSEKQIDDYLNENKKYKI